MGDENARRVRLAGQRIEDAGATRHAEDDGLPGKG